MTTINSAIAIANVGTIGATAAVTADAFAGEAILGGIVSPAGEPATATLPYYLYVEEGVDGEFVIVTLRAGSSRLLANTLTNSYTTAATVAYAGLATTAADGLLTARDFAVLKGVSPGADATTYNSVKSAGALMEEDIFAVDPGVLQTDGSGFWSVLKHNLTAVGAPTVNDDENLSYSVGSRWIVSGAGELVCLDATSGAAVWALSAEVSPDPIPGPSDASPQPLGTASAGVSDDYARSDHVHDLPAAPLSVVIGATIVTTTADFSDLDDGTVYPVNLGPGDDLVVSVGDANPNNPAGKLVGFIPVGTGSVSIAAAGSMTVNVNAFFNPTSAGTFSPIYVLIAGTDTCFVYGDLEAV